MNCDCSLVHRLSVLCVWLFDYGYLQILDFNQNFLIALWTVKGYLFKMVSFLILLRVLLPQTGHNTHLLFIFNLLQPPYYLSTLAEYPRQFSATKFLDNRFT